MFSKKLKILHFKKNVIFHYLCKMAIKILKLKKNLNTSIIHVYNIYKL